MNSKMLVGGAIASVALLVCACQEDAGPTSVDNQLERSPASASHGGGSTGSTGSTEEPRSGAKDATLRVRLVDAPTEEVTSIVVTVAKVEANVAGEWLIVAEAEHTVDLLTLQNGSFLDLGAAKLPAGHVEQIRLKLVEGGDHHVVTPDGLSHPLEIPSGEQSGIKLVGGFDLAPCSTAQLTVDFDGKKSLSLGANKQGWRLRPVVRIKALVSEGTCEQPLADDAGADAGDDAAAPLEDPCASVTCTETEICDNGTCRAAQ